MRAWCAYLFHKAIASLLSATGKVSREVCRGKQGQLKVFAYVPLLCESVVKVKLGAATCLDSQHPLNESDVTGHTVVTSDTLVFTA